MYPKGFRFLCFSFLILMYFKPAMSSSVSYQGLGEDDDDDGSRDDSGERHYVGDVETVYDFRWSYSSSSSSSSSSSGKDIYSVKFEASNCTENQTCNVATDCDHCFPNIDLAFQPGMPTDIPQRPLCTNNMTLLQAPKEEGECTCGPGMCFSYSRFSLTEMNFYYCGPCGYVGASCESHRCINSMAECRNGFCECVYDGIFYDMSVCKIPYYGTKMLTQMFISTVIIVLLCGVLAYSYHRLSSSRRRYFRRFNSWRRSSVVRESPPEDTPPTYDDVVEKVPSYEDALDMENSNTKGVTNPAYTEEEGLPPTYEESIIRADSTDAAPTAESESTEESPAMSQEAVTIPGEGEASDTKVAAAASSTSPNTDHQPIEQPLKNALEEFRDSSPVTPE